MMRIIISTCLVFMVCLSGGLNAQRHVELLDARNYSFTEISDIIEKEYKDGLLSPRDYKHFKRWEMYNAPFLDEQGKVSGNDGLHMRELAKYRRTHPDYFNNSQRVSHGHWETVSPSQFSPVGPANGRLNCVAVSPTNTSHIYVGAAVGGIWKSTNDGASWTNITHGIPVSAISDIAINPENSNNIYALTGDGEARYMPSSGVIESTDGGSTWSFTGLTIAATEGIYGYKLLMDPVDPDRMYIASNNGIYRTYDGWNTFTMHDTLTSYRDIEFAPGSNDTMYAASWKSIYKSQDGGNNWDNLNNNGLGLPNTSSMSRVAIAISPESPSTLYAIYAWKDADPSVVGFYVSQDYGSSFTSQSIDSNLVGGQPSYDLAIEADPLNSQKIFVGGVQLWYSSWYGADGTWSLKANGDDVPSIHADIHDIHHDVNRILVATDGGLAASVDAGTTWTNLSDGLNIMQFYDIDVDPASPDRMMGGTQDNGTKGWTEGAINGAHLKGGDGFEVMYDPSTSSRLYYCTQNERFRSENNGSSETNITPPMILVVGTPRGSCIPLTTIHFIVRLRISVGHSTGEIVGLI